jgi:hypothetical protein
MFKAIKQRIKLGDTSPSQIGKALMKDSSTVRRYLIKMKNLPSDSPFFVASTESGRIQIGPNAEAAQQYSDLQKDEFVISYPSVKKWVDDMSVRKDGKPLAQLGDLVRRLKTVCDTLKVSPELIVLEGLDESGKEITPRENIEKVYRQFAIEFGKTHTTNPHGYKMALRNYAMSCNINWARGVSGLMSGKKIGYGKYAHIKLSDEQIEQAVKIARFEMGNELLARRFRLGIETCARAQALDTIPVDSIEMHPATNNAESFITVRATESKTGTTWQKFIVAPLAQEMMLDQVSSQKATGHQFLFLDGIALEKFEAEMNASLKELYRRLGLTDAYFFAHPTHALRHCGAQYWLRITNWDYDLVGIIGGWKSSVLKEAYGARPAESILEAVNEATRRLHK